MVVVKKGIIVGLLWVIASVAWAKEDPTFINEQQEDEIINLAYTQMRASIEALERKIDECKALAKDTTLDPALFQSLPLTKQEARTALGYFRSRAQEKCEDMGLWAKVAIEFAQFKHIEKSYKGKNIIETEDYLEIICCMSSDSRFETIWRYLKIAPEIREKLERIPELQKPFNFITTAEEMGLF
ncbi:MAG TPA: hypothetical protein ENI94_01570 [Gammaproteobacteria bacterium]|nr:hypothetical protein [Gammaproteobacteria bacterium]